MYSYVSDKLAGLLESLSTVMAAVREPAAVNVFLVVSGTRGERPVEGVNIKNVKLVLGEARQVYLNSTFRQQGSSKCFTEDVKDMKKQKGI